MRNFAGKLERVYNSNNRWNNRPNEDIYYNFNVEKDKKNLILKKLIPMPQFQQNV